MKIEDTLFEFLCEEADKNGLDIMDEGVVKAISDKAKFLAGEAKKAGKSFKAGYDYSRLVGGMKSPLDDPASANKKAGKAITRTGGTPLAAKAGAAAGKVVNKGEQGATIAIAQAFAKKNQFEDEFKKWKATGETKLSEFKAFLKSKGVLKESYFGY